MHYCKNFFYFTFIVFNILFIQSTFAKENICRAPVDLSFYTIGYLYFLDDKEYKGIDKDVIDELKLRTNCVFRSTLMARARIWEEMRNHRLSATVSGIPTKERELFAHFVSYFLAKNKLLVHTKFTNAKTLDEVLENKEISFTKVRSFKHGKIFDEMFEILTNQERVKDVVNVEDTFLSVRNGEAQALVSLNVVIPFWIKQLQLEKELTIVPTNANEDKIPHGLVLSKAEFTIAQAEQFKKVIDDMTKDGTLQRIYAKYLGNEVANEILIEVAK